MSVAAEHRAEIAKKYGGGGGTKADEVTTTPAIVTSYAFSRRACKTFRPLGLDKLIKRESRLALEKHLDALGLDYAPNLKRYRYFDDTGALIFLYVTERDSDVID